MFNIILLVMVLTRRKVQYDVYGMAAHRFACYCCRFLLSLPAGYQLAVPYPLADWRSLPITSLKHLRFNLLRLC